MSEDLNKKIVDGLERISEVFKTLYWNKAKLYGVSPIQIQILLFVATHKTDLCTVSQLALEFNLSKPTISDAVRVLINKGLVKKAYFLSDSRSYSLIISEKGKELVLELKGFAKPLLPVLQTMSEHNASEFYQTITQIIYHLNQSGIISVQRTCYACRFYSNQSGKHYCNLMEKPLLGYEIRLDCDEFETNRS
ncbi:MULTISPECIES: MarR family winged helix-turn-helix transcriptional regulator [unclassified Saccharicrinis]|uniref:MarR family winged helix-turn-helix transcriptional regulator n=1 Tax=unclassified Saccharicrinis TaxID=2646859 RepID=UPI003D354230